MSSSKKKKEKKKDFVKQKLKVGKQKPKASTHTDTSFRTKSISLPNQSLVETGKSLTHYLQLLKHHSKTTRKESLLYIQRHFILAPGATAAAADFQLIVQKTCPLLLDEYNSVRNAAVEVLGSVPRQVLDTSTAHISLYIHMSMTHIRPEIRDSSTRALELLVRQVPRQVCRVAFANSLRGFVTLLGWQGLATMLGKNKASGVGKNSVIVEASLELNRDVVKSKTAHVKALGTLLRASLLADDVLDEYSNDSTKTFGEGEEESEDEEVVFIGSDVEDTEKPSISAASTDEEIREFMLARLAASEPLRPSIGLKFTVPKTSLPYLSLNLFPGHTASSTARSNTASSSQSRSPVTGLAATVDPATVSITEDRESRRQLLDHYKPVFIEGLQMLIKEGGELGRHSKQTLDMLRSLEE